MYMLNVKSESEIGSPLKFDQKIIFCQKMKMTKYFINSIFLRDGTHIELHKSQSQVLP